MPHGRTSVNPRNTVGFFYSFRRRAADIRVHRYCFVIFIRFFFSVSQVLYRLAVILDNDIQKTEMDKCVLLRFSRLFRHRIFCSCPTTDLSTENRTSVLRTAFRWWLNVRISASKCVTLPTFGTVATVAKSKRAEKKKKNKKLRYILYMHFKSVRKSHFFCNKVVQEIDVGGIEKQIIRNGVVEKARVVVAQTARHYQHGHGDWHR